MLTEDQIALHCPHRINQDMLPASKVDHTKLVVKANPITQKIVIELQELPVDVELYYQGILIKTIPVITAA